MNTATDSVSTQPTFPMRVVARTTGLTPDLVRAWERRYRAISPGRTEGNARRYSQADIERLQLLRDAVAEGHSISNVASLQNDALLRLCTSAKRVEQKLASNDVVERYLSAVACYDLPAAEALLSRAAQLVGPRETVINLISPLMRAVGERWHAGRTTVAEEHAVSAQVRALLATLLRTANLPRGAPRVLIGAPEGHHHELGALVAAVLASELGIQPIYLGPDVPWKDLGVAAKAARANLIVLSMSFRPDPATLRRERTALARVAKETEVWLGVSPGYPIKASDRVRVFDDYVPFESALSHRYGL